MNGRDLDERIDALVDSWRRIGGVASPEQIIDAKQVAVVLLARHRGDVPERVVRNALAPIFCADPAEQTEFHDQFEKLRISALPDTPDPEPDGKQRRRARKPRPGIVRRWKLVRVATVAVSFVMLLAVAGLVIDTLLPQPPPVTGQSGDRAADGNGAGSATEPSRGTAPESTGGATLSPDLSFQPPPRPPAPVELLSGVDAKAVAVGTWLLAALPLVIGLTALAKGIAGRRVFLAGDRSRSHPEIKAIPIEKSSSGPFAYSRLAGSVMEMRQVRRHDTRRLDARQTVERTARAGGYPTLAFESRTRRPGYVLLIERRNAFDFFAHATRALADFLHGAGLEVYAYAFQGRPHRLTPLWRKGKQATYQEVLQRYHGDALIVAGDPGMIRRGSVSGANPWRPDTSAWSSLGLLTSNASEAWNHEEEWFHERRFAVAALDSQGFATLANWVANGGEGRDQPTFAWKPDLDALFPPLLADDPERWLEDFENPDTPRMLAQLRAYLGDDGFLLFAATVAYPELRWPIATFLNERLFDDDPDSAEAEDRLLRMARLPWCREGRMPGYLRRALLLELNVEQREQIQASYYRLLNTASGAAETGPSLDIADLDSGTMRDFLRQMLSTAPPGAYRDYIFQSVLLDPPRDMLGIELERRRARQIGRARWRDALPDIVRLAQRTAIATAVAAFVAFVWVKPMATAGFEKYNLLANGSLTARVLYRPETAVAAGEARSTGYLAERMRWALEAQGFNVELEELPAELQSLLAQSAGPQPPDVSRPASRADPLAAAIVPNLVFYDTNAGVSMIGTGEFVPDRDANWLSGFSTPLDGFAELIAARLRHETYAQPVVTAIKSSDAATLFGPAANDAESGNSASAGMLGFLRASDLQSSTAGSDIIVVLAEDTRAFQDRLTKGGLGPVMTLVPAGALDTGRAAEPKPATAPVPAQVIFSRPFAIGKYEVTVGEFARFRQSTQPDASADVDPARAVLPMTDVTKVEAQAYAEWLSDVTGASYRLPRDAEWEYAARAGQSARDAGEPLPAGPDLQLGSDGIVGVVNAEPRPNSWGLHGMQDLVAEWVDGCFVPGQVDRGNRCLADTVRSGSWQESGTSVDLSPRQPADPGFSTTTVGFRVLRELPAVRRREPGRSLTVDPGNEEAQEAGDE